MSSTTRMTGKAPSRFEQAKARLLQEGQERLEVEELIADMADNIHIIYTDSDRWGFGLWQLLLELYLRIERAYYV